MNDLTAVPSALVRDVETVSDLDEVLLSSAGTTAKAGMGVVRDYIGNGILNEATLRCEEAAALAAAATAAALAFEGLQEIRDPIVLTGDGVQTSVAFDVVPDIRSVFMTVGGVAQTPGVDFYFVGNNLTFPALPLGEPVVIRFYEEAVLSTTTRFASRQSLVAAIAGGLVPINGMVYIAGDLLFQGKTGSTAIADMPGMIPASTVYAQHFGAVEDYNSATESGTDDTAAIQAAMDYMDDIDTRISGGEVYIKRHALVSGTLVPPIGVKLVGLVPPMSTINGQTADSTVVTYDRGSAIISSATTMPVIWLRRNQTGVKDLTIGATSARYNAAIAAGFANVNCGILAATDDVAVGALVYPNIENVLIQDQPADGVMTCGDVVNFRYDRVEVTNVGRHGHVLDDGQLVGRTNKARPGLGTLIDCRAENTGGHHLAIGHPNSGSNVPYRIYVLNFECFRCGNNGAQMYASSSAYIAAEQVTVVSAAFGATSGFSGTTPTLSYCVAVAGRNNTFLGCRFISSTVNAVRVINYTGVGSRGILVQNCMYSTQATVANFISIETGSFVRMLRVVGCDGVHTSEVLSAANVAPEWTIEIVDDDKTITYGGQTQHITRLPIKSDQGFTSGSFSLANDTATALDLIGAGETARHGVMMLSANLAAGMPSLIWFRVGDNQAVSVLSGSATGTTGVLSGTTGTSGNLSVSASGESIYIENRTGGLRTYAYTFLSLTTT